MVHEAGCELASGGGDAPWALGYAGLAFALHAEDLSPRFPADYGPYVAAPDTDPTIAQVTCRVMAGGDLSGAQPNRAEYQEQAHGFTLRGDYVAAEVEVSGSRAMATARIVSEPMGWAALLRFLGAGVIERLGGVSLHAAGVVVDDRVVLLLGPSGAGKSTACDLCPSWLTFAYDQVVVYPDPSGPPGGYRVWALPWGQASRNPRTEARSLPLAACLRVTRGTPATTAWRADGARGLFELRQATTVNERTPLAEERRLGALFSLMDAVPVGYLSTVLGERAEPAIADFLASEASAPAARSAVATAPEVRA